MHRHNLTFIALGMLSFATLHAAELTIQKKPYRIEQSFEATILPTASEVFRLDAESGSSFTIESIATHGTRVKKGDSVIRFDREDYDHQLAELEHTVKLAQIDLAEKKFALEEQQKETELQLAAVRRAKTQTDEDLAYFEKIGRPAKKKSVEQSLASSEFRVASAEEELKQLREMYRKDDLTEETEEIILERQEFAVELAHHNHREAQRRAKKTRETELPRQHEALKQRASEASLSLAKAEANLPRAVERAKIELEKTEAALTKEKQKLARLKQDATLFEWKAPIDGRLLFGGITDHRWKLGDIAKVLKPEKSVPTRQPLVTIVPKDASPAFVAWLEPDQARTLATETSVTAILPNREDIPLSGTISQLDPIISTDGKQRVSLDLTWPEKVAKPWLTTVQCHVITYENPEAIVVPQLALSPQTDGGWSVEVKLADGKTEYREVTTGRANGKQIEITTGLEPGQVVVVPES